MRVLLHFSTHHTAREPPLSLVESGGREGRGEEAHIGGGLWSALRSRVTHARARAAALPSPTPGGGCERHKTVRRESSTDGRSLSNGKPYLPKKLKTTFYQ